MTLRRNPQKAQRRESIRQEARFADRAGGRRQPGSGAYWGAPGDVKIGRRLLGEMKRTGAKQITITANVLEKIFNEAWASGRRPLEGFELNGKNYVVQAEEDFLEREELIRELLAEETPSQSRQESSQCSSGGRSG